MVEILFSIAAKVSEYLVAPIGRQLGYMFCYRTNTLELRNKVEELTKNRDDLQITIDQATRRGDQIRPVVREWLNRVNEVTKEVEDLLNDGNNKSCFNLKSRYQLGREATKKAKVIVAVQEAHNFPEGISFRVPPRAATFRQYECYESRASTLNKIMDALRDDDNMKVIGVWGMGGVGKTTLVKQVAEEAKQQKLFNTQVYADVSWTREDVKIQQGIRDIQQHIADMLGLKFEEDTTSARAAKLMERLTSEKILIILDDLWKEVPLEDVGIPSCNKDCKILLASRQEYLLRQGMGAQECFPIQYLQEGEAWQLFKKTAGDSVENDLERKPIAIDIVKQCGGLPIAIVMIAKTLKERSVAVWKNALRELKSTSLGAASSNNKEEDPVYKCLALSYNHLKDDELKSLFLLCGCLSYGDIPMDQLLSYALGLDFFDRIKSIEEARDKLVTLVSDLKASSLLLDGEGDGGKTLSLLFMDAADGDQTVRMHDLVRDVARNIASKDPHRFVVIEDVPSEEDWSKVHESKFISLNCNVEHELPHGLVCPKLQFFLLQNYSPLFNIPDKFFEGMNQLKVLDLFGMDFETLPSVLQSLANLRTLWLERCYSLRDIAGIGQLKKLHVLSMRGSGIRQLPQDMAQLTNLRLLNLNNCQKLEVIPRNILSKLFHLECLFMNSRFSKWAPEEDSDNGELSNIACLSELNRLDNLTSIEIKILDAKLVPEEDKFFQNLTSFAIFIGNLRQWEEISYERSKILMLKGGDGSLLLRNGMRKLLEKAKEIKLSKLRGSPITNNEKNDSIKGLCSPPRHVSFQYLKCLSISDCQGNVTSILTGDGVLFGEKVLLPNLEKLNITRFSMLKMIWHPQLSFDGPLDKFQVLRVYDCPCLVNLIPSHLMQSLQNLKEVIVDDCKVLENVFGHGELNGENKILPNIEILKLRNLPKLRHRFDTQGSDDNMRYILSPSKFKDFHRMKELHVIDCRMFLDEKVSFSSNLEVLILERCSKLNEIEFANPQKLRILSLKKLPELSSSVSYKDGNAIKRCRLSPSMSENFYSLKYLKIADCGMQDRRDVCTPIDEKVSFVDGGDQCNYEAFESRALIVNKIMEALRDNNIKSVGVVGIEGVGKTTLVKQVARQTHEQHLFTDQLYLDLSWTRYTDDFQQPKDKIVKIQRKIANMLRWGYDRRRYRSNSELVVAMKRELKVKKILIIVDDIWKKINLDEIGIPSCEHDDENKCKTVLITSRYGDGEELCKEMGAQICFPMETLPPEEARTLFKKTASSGGTDWVVEEEKNNNTEEALIRSSIAKKVVEECEGLPIALVTNAKALKDESVTVWKNALGHLISCAITNMSVVGKKFYSFLGKGDDFKSLLLLCGMLDYGDISIDHLLQYAIGLNLFGPIDSLDQARNRLLELVEILRDDHHPEPEDRHRNLVMRMHHVVYDAVREIAAQDPRAFIYGSKGVSRLLEEWLKSNDSKKYAFISLHVEGEIFHLPQALVCSELQFFRVHFKNRASSIPIPNKFFQGMKKLQVLDLSNMGFTTLPLSIDSLANLRTLRLNGCSDLVNIDEVGKLTKLEVLSLVGTAIQYLPDDMSQLTNLRLLDLSDSKKLEFISQNLLSCLCKLQYLSMALPNAMWLPEGIQFENSSARYVISIGGFRGKSMLRTDRILRLKKIDISSNLGYAICKLLERSEELTFENLSGTNYVLQYPSNEENFRKLKHLQVIGSPKIQYIIVSVLDQSTSQQHDVAFPLLESLVLRKMQKLEQVWHGSPIPRGSFGNLKTLDVYSCHELRYLFSLFTAKGLSQLEYMAIEYCNKMQQIISCEKEFEDENGGTNLELFCNLRTLKLLRLPQLINFISELDTNAWPQDSSFRHKVSFSKLVELELLEVPELKDVWNPQGPFGSLPNLRNSWVCPDSHSNYINDW